MVTICLQCGDVGYANAFVYCIKCLDVAVHRYCLPKLPKTFDEFVPWVCEDCEVESAGTATGLELIRNDSIDKSNKSITHLTTTTGIQKSNDHTGSSLQSAYDKLDSRKDFQLAGDCRSSGVELRAGNDPDLPTLVAEEQGCQIGSSRQIHEPQGVDPSLLRVGPLVPSTSSSRSTAKGKSCKKKKRRNLHKQKDGIEKRDVNWVVCFNCQQIGHYKANCKEPKKENEFSSSASRKAKESSKSTICTRACEASSQQVIEYAELASNSPFPNNLKKDVSCSEATIADHKREADRRKQETLVPLRGHPSVAAPDCLERAKPLINPIWRGSFNIINSNDDALEGFVGHLSSRACRQVYEEACMIPSLLHLEMLPKVAVWPKSFEKAEPTAGNIALYFFPADIRYERTFDRLVEEMTRREFAMRASVKNADLLIFTSTELPLVNWRFQNKYYLWGVFRAKQPVSSHAVTNKPPMAPSLAPGRNYANDSGIRIGHTLRRTCIAGNPLSPVSNNGKFVYGNF